MFTIVVPTFNRKRHVLSLLESLEKQTCVDFEVVVVDDHSDVDIRDIGESNYRFQLKLLRNSTNKGQAYSRNKAIKNAANQWIVFLDDHDRFDNRKLEKLKNCIERCAEKPDLIYHSAKIVMMNEKHEYLSISSQYHNYFRNLLIKNVVGGTPMVTINQNLIAKCGYFDESLRALEDYEYWLRAAKYGARLLYIDEPLTICRCWTKSGSVSKNVDRVLNAITKIHERYRNDYRKISFSEAKQHKAWILAMIGHKYFLNYKRKGCLNYFKAFVVTGNIRFLFAGIVGFINPRILFKIR